MPSISTDAKLSFLVDALGAIRGLIEEDTYTR